MYQMSPGNPADAHNGGPGPQAYDPGQAFGYGPHWHQHAHPFGPGHAAGYGPMAPGQPQGPAALGLLNNRFVTGMLVGSALTYVLTNEHVQRAAIRGITQVWLGIQGALEETKERFRDAESEVKANHGE
ncbi:hypothetical protein AUC68_00575 [Methyloceanibacter methanicus]|uniref:YtxH domain-containing protein n=2 Tax=Methyloceanibacter methanicus TaxID=1774968 RepID=A0A1E3W6F6_9HYPH|nr:hypothetical protein AUC68_00575 [Methyloceanibacter methanicus]